jgi:hypothetical protein
MIENPDMTMLNFSHVTLRGRYTSSWAMYGEYSTYEPISEDSGDDGGSLSTRGRKDWDESYTE